MMTAMQITCSACGAELPPDAPHGLCPACLFQLDEPPVTGPSSDSEVCGLDTAFGTSRFGEYELLEEIARGGMGIVYKARQPSIHRIVAVKMILFGSLANAEQVRRFRIEATAAGSLHHPNIVAVHEVGLHQGQNFMVMDYVDGPNLSRLVQDQPLPARKSRPRAPRLLPATASLPPRTGASCSGREMQPILKWHRRWSSFAVIIGILSTLMFGGRVADRRRPGI